MSKVNSFYCPHCKAYTRHAELTYREESAIENESMTVQLIGSLMNDYVGIRKVISFFGYTSYKCIKCGRCAERKANGEETRFIGYSK